MTTKTERAKCKGVTWKGTASHGRNRACTRDAMTPAGFCLGCDPGAQASRAAARERRWDAEREHADAIRAAEERKARSVEAVIAHARAWGGMQHTAEVDDLLAADDALRVLGEKEAGR